MTSHLQVALCFLLCFYDTGARPFAQVNQQFVQSNSGLQPQPVLVQYQTSSQNNPQINRKFVQTSQFLQPTVVRRALPRVVYRPAVANHLDWSDFISVPNNRRGCLLDAGLDDFDMDFLDPQGLQSSDFVLLSKDEDDGTFFINDNGQAFLVPNNQVVESSTQSVLPAGYGTPIQQSMLLPSPRGYTSAQQSFLTTPVKNKNPVYSVPTKKMGYMSSSSQSFISPVRKNVHGGSSGSQMFVSPSNKISKTVQSSNTKNGYSTGLSSQSFESPDSKEGYSSSSTSQSLVSSANSKPGYTDLQQDAVASDIGGTTGDALVGYSSQTNSQQSFQSQPSPVQSKQAYGTIVQLEQPAASTQDSPAPISSNKAASYSTQGQDSSQQAGTTSTNYGSQSQNQLQQAAVSSSTANVPPNGYGSSSVPTAQQFVNLVPNQVQRNTKMDRYSTAQNQQQNAAAATLMRQYAQKYGTQALNQMLQNVNTKNG